MLDARLRSVVPPSPAASRERVRELDEGERRMLRTFLDRLDAQLAAAVAAEDEETRPRGGLEPAMR